MHKKSLIIFILSVVLTTVVFAQQQATFTQYMFNGMSINPGYIGTHDGLSVTALSRWQWLGIEGAPSTQTIAIHSPIPGKNIGIGAQFVHDQISITKTTSFLLGYSYKVGIGDGFLNMGLQGGVQNFRNDLSSLYTINPDPTFSQSVSGFKPNFGAGLFYYNSIFYTGVSAPYLINNKIEVDGDNAYTQQRHYFMTAGVMLSVNPAVKLKPNLLVRVVEGSPISMDYNLNVLLKDILWLGVSYRPPESVNFLIELNINQQFRVGYAFDYIIDQTLSQETGSSHEVMLNYVLRWSKSNVVTPRYF